MLRVFGFGKLSRGWTAAACLALCVAVGAHAQGRGGGPPSGGGGSIGGPPGGGMGGPQFPGAGGPGADGVGVPQFPGNRGGLNVPQNGPQPSPRQPDARAGLQLGPAGQRWWDDRGYVKNLKLRPEQQARMDAIFEQNRTALVSRFESVQQAEAQLNELAGAPDPDESALFAQIDRVEQARAELEKANTHLLLELRRQMDADQIQKLESRR